MPVMLDPLQQPLLTCLTGVYRTDVGLGGGSGGAETGRGLDSGGGAEIELGLGGGGGGGAEIGVGLGGRRRLAHTKCPSTTEAPNHNQEIGLGIVMKVF